MALLPGTCLAIAPGMWVVKMLVAAERGRKANKSVRLRISISNSKRILTSSTDRVSNLGNQQDHGSDRSDT